MSPWQSFWPDQQNPLQMRGGACGKRRSWTGQLYQCIPGGPGICITGAWGIWFLPVFFTSTHAPGLALATVSRDPQSCEVSQWITQVWYPGAQEADGTNKATPGHAPARVPSLTSLSVKLLFDCIPPPPGSMSGFHEIRFYPQPP